MAGLKDAAKSWKTWGVIVSALVATIVLFEKAQPYVEGYAAKQLREEVMALKVAQYETKREVIARLDSFEVMLAEMKTKVDKDLILATIKAVREAEVVSAP